MSTTVTYPNVAAGMAHAAKDAALIAIFDGLNPKEALERVENLIETSGRLGKWDDIVIPEKNRPKLFGGFHNYSGLLELWLRLIAETISERKLIATEVGRKVIDLLNKYFPKTKESEPSHYQSGVLIELHTQLLKAAIQCYENGDEPNAKLYWDSFWHMETLDNIGWKHVLTPARPEIFLKQVSDSISLDALFCLAKMIGQQYPINSIWSCRDDDKTIRRVWTAITRRIRNRGIIDLLGIIEPLIRLHANDGLNERLVTDNCRLSLACAAFSKKVATVSAAARHIEKTVSKQQDRLRAYVPSVLVDYDIPAIIEVAICIDTKGEPVGTRNSVSVTRLIEKIERLKKDMLADLRTYATEVGLTGFRVTFVCSIRPANPPNGDGTPDTTSEAEEIPLYSAHELKTEVA